MSADFGAQLDAALNTGLASIRSAAEAARARVDEAAARPVPAPAAPPAATPRPPAAPRAAASPGAAAVDFDLDLEDAFVGSPPPDDFEFESPVDDDGIPLPEEIGLEPR
jgi:hypothetical protein